jgi:hypothetical protein
MTGEAAAIIAVTLTIAVLVCLYVRANTARRQKRERQKRSRAQALAHAMCAIAERRARERSLERSSELERQRLSRNGAAAVRGHAEPPLASVDTTTRRMRRSSPVPAQPDMLRTRGHVDTVGVHELNTALSGIPVANTQPDGAPWGGGGGEGGGGGASGSWDSGSSSCDSGSSGGDCGGGSTGSGD